MNRFRKSALVTAVGASLLTASATPAQASSRDCSIYGPEYVAEVVDCAISILEKAIG